MEIAPYLSSNTTMAVSWDSFHSDVGMFIYYVALSSAAVDNGTCNSYVSWLLLLVVWLLFCCSSTAWPCPLPLSTMALVFCCCFFSCCFLVGVLLFIYYVALSSAAVDNGTCNSCVSRLLLFLLASLLLFLFFFLLFCCCFVVHLLRGLVLCRCRQWHL